MTQDTTSSEAVDLLPCPFCGGEAQIVSSPSGAGGSAGSSWSVRCKTCDARTREGPPPPAFLHVVKAWNTRLSTIKVASQSGEDALRICENYFANLSVMTADDAQTAFNAVRAALRVSPPTVTASDEGVVRFSLDERDDDMLIAERHWQYGWWCIARRPKLMSNDEWRPVAQRIIAALAYTSKDTPAPPSSDGLRDALECAECDLAATYEATKAGKPIVISIGQFGRLRRIRAALASTSQR